MRKQDRKAQLRQPVASPAPNAVSTTDSFQNFLTRVGMGTGNQFSASTYGVNYISRNRQQLENAYKSSWICQKAVDTIAEDMVKAGIDITSDLEPSKIDELQTYLKKLRVADSLIEALKWSRLFGGSILIAIVSGQRLDSPLRIETVGPDQFKGCAAIDRWLLQPSTDLITINDLDGGTATAADLGKPKFYELVGDTNGIPRGNIHFSRLSRFEGQLLPWYARQAEQNWGASVLEKMWERLLAYDSTTLGIAQLALKAHLRVLKVPGLRDILAAGGEAMESLLKQIAAIRTLQNNEGLTLLNGGLEGDRDDYEAHTFSFAGLPDTLMQFAQQLAGALGIPMVKLLGISPGGLNSTGLSDLNLYHAEILQQQESGLRSAWEFLLQLAYRSKFGSAPPAAFSFTFNPLWTMSDAEKAIVAKSTTDSIVAARNAQVISKATALRELKQSSHVTGIYTNITDDEIAAAEKEDEVEFENSARQDADPAASNE